MNIKNWIVFINFARHFGQMMCPFAFEQKKTFVLLIAPKIPTTYSHFITYSHLLQNIFFLMFVNQRKIKRNEVVINNFTESTSVSDKVLDTFIFLDTFVCTCL